MNKKNIAIHAAVWIGYATFNHLINMATSLYEEGPYILDTIAKYCIAASIFYWNTSFSMHRFLSEKKSYWKFSISLLAILLLSFALKQLLYNSFIIYLNYPGNPYTILQSFFMHLWWWFQYTILAFGFWFGKKTIYQERQRIHMATELLKVEKEKNFAEHNFLRAQINPHFLYNTLNFIYSKSINSSNEQLSNAIVHFSEMLRYCFEINEDEKGFVLVEEELNQINRLILLNGCRFSNQNIQSELNIKAPVKIIPFVLTTFVENVFKHGDITNAEFPVKLRAEISPDNVFLFDCINKKPVSKLKDVEGKTGFGLDNVKKRLIQTYGEKHELQIVDSPLEYHVTLKISL